MNILLVEGGSDGGGSLAPELEKNGYTVRRATGSIGALAACFGESRPDVVITDARLPDGDGFDLAHKIRERAAPNWQPVVCLVDACEGGTQTEASTRIGTVDLVFRPVSSELLEAKLASIRHALSAQRPTEERAIRFTPDDTVGETDQLTAQYLIRRLVSFEKLDDPAVRFWVAPATPFSGDVVAVTRTPGNQMHILLADGSGHGLSASLNVLPIIAPFYRMTEKGFGIDAISREMNAKIRQLLPRDRFVAATLIAIDFREGYARVWNGGNPPPLLLDRSGHVEHGFSVRYPPLGARDDGEFEPLTETRAVGLDSQLVVYSDGLVNAESPSTETFGIGRLIAALAAPSTEACVDRIRAAIGGHLGGGAAKDDMAVLVVACSDAGDTPSEPARPAVVPQQIADANWKLTLQMGATELRQLDVVPMLLDLTHRFESARRHSGELFVIFSELFNNALDHGLLGLDSRLKLAPDGMDAYFSERASRLARLERGSIEFELAEFSLAGRNWMRVVVRDSGTGFDYGAVLRDGSGQEEMPFGRGLALIRSMVSSFEFNEAGNVANVVIGLTDDVAPAHGLA